MEELSTFAQKQIDFFSRKGVGYQDFLVLTAQPMLFSADLLYQLWANFRAYRHTSPQVQAPYLVVSDLLLSGLCETVNADHYRLSDGLRHLLSAQLPDKIRQEVAYFIKDYALRYQGALGKNMYNIYLAWATNVLSPAHMEEQIIQQLSKAQNDYQRGTYLSLYFNLLKESGITTGQKHVPRISMEYAEERDVADVLQIPYWRELEGEVKEVEEEEKTEERPLALQLIEESLRTKNPYLDLGNCGLDGTEEYLELLGGCVHLETLVFSNEWREIYITGSPWDDADSIWDDALGSWDEFGDNNISIHSKDFNSVNENNQNLLIQLPPYLPHNLQKLVISGTYQKPWKIRDLTPLKELQNIQELYFSSNQVQDLQFIQNLKSLQKLDLNKNKVQDLKPISKLNKLLYLNFSSNQVQDLAPIQKLTYLRILSFYKNQVQELVPIKRLNYLRILSCDKNQIQDLSPIRELKDLQKLYFSDNRIQELFPIQSLMNLQALDISDNEIQDLSTIQGLIGLQELDISDNQVQDLFPIQDLVNLQTLDISDNQVDNLYALRDLQQLQTLDISNNQVDNLYALRDLQQLQTLNISDNQVQDLNYLKGLGQLQKLDFSGNQVQDLSPLKDVQQLQKLDFSGNQVQDLSPLKDLQQLQRLDFSSNQVRHLSPLKDLQRLQKLYFSNNQVQDLSPLKSLQQLQKLYFSNNQVQDLNAIKGLYNLQELYFFRNQVQNLQPIKSLNNLRELDCSFNQIQGIDWSLLQQLPYLNMLILINNPVQNIPKQTFYKQGNCLKEVKNYFLGLRNSEESAKKSGQKLYALLVGIDEYHPDSYGVSRLRGSVNDVNATEDLLNNYYNDLNPQIYKLTNEQATYDNVIKYFEKYLINNAAPNVTILFWFSGHGSTQNNNSRFDRHQEETLVCYDSRIFQNNQFLNPDFSDKEFQKLVDLVIQKNAEVISILDCCHSSTRTREMHDDITQIRFVSNRNNNKILPTSSDSSGKKINISSIGQITLSACKKNEIAREMMINGQQRGVFSYHLQKILKETPKIGYVHLLSRISVAMQQGNLISPQTPQFEIQGNFDMYRAFLKTLENQLEDQLFKIFYIESESEWIAEVGVFQGIPTIGIPVKFIIYQNNKDLNTPISYASTTRIGDRECIVKPENPEKMYKDMSYWGKLLSLGLNPLPIYLDGESSAKIKLKNLVKETKRIYFLLDNYSGNEFKVLLKPKSWQLYKEGECILEEELHYQTILSKLSQIGRYQALLYKQNPDTQLQPNDFNFTLESDSGDQALVGYMTFQEKIFICSRSEFDLSHRLSVKFITQNNTNSDLYFTLLYFSPSFGIEVMCIEQVPANTSSPFMLREVGLFIDQKDKVTDYFQLFVSTKKINYFQFSQPSIVQSLGRATKPSSDILIPEDWCTITLGVELHKAKKEEEEENPKSL